MKIATIIFAVFLAGHVLAEEGAEKAGTDGAEKDPVYVICHGLDLRGRLRAAHVLPSDLSWKQTQDLYQFLKSQPVKDERSLVGLRYLKNEVLNALENQDESPPGLSSSLIEIYQDHGQDFVTRDYAIQHLITWYERGTRDARNAREQIRATLIEAAGENDSIAGTALLGMHRLARTDIAFGKDEIKKLALGIVQNTQANAAARITSIQVCAERGILEALPAIEAMAQAHGQIALQTSAISALGRLGGPSQAVLLRRLKSVEGTPLKPVIHAALAKLEPNVAGGGPF